MMQWLLLLAVAGLVYIGARKSPTAAGGGAPAGTTPRPKPDPEPAESSPSPSPPIPEPNPVGTCRYSMVSVDENDQPLGPAIPFHEGPPGDNSWQELLADSEMPPGKYLVYRQCGGPALPQELIGTHTAS